jgi:beta-galactosidase
VNSYDYDTLLDESGEPTEKYWAVRKVLERYAELPEPRLPAPIPKRAYGEVRLESAVGLFSQLDRLASPVRRTNPDPMEKVGQAYGFIVYSTRVSGPRSGMSLNLQEVRDRALVFADGAYVGTVERWNPVELPLEVPAEGLRLDILVENMGRVNYGPLMRDPKGITEGVRLGNQFLYDWTVYPLPMESLAGLEFGSLPQEKTGSQPTFYRGSFNVEGRADTFVRFDGWTKGVAFLNGFNLGRYWEAGPTRTLYVPAPLLREGENELIVFELHGTKGPVVKLTDKADLG